MTISHIISKQKTIKMKKKLFLFALSTPLLFQLSCSSEESKEKAPLEKTAKSSKASFIVRKSDLALMRIQNTKTPGYAFISGRVVPRSSTQLVAEVQGRLRQGKSVFKEGNMFQKGEVILRVESQEFALHLEAQKSSFLNILTGMMPDMKADYASNYEAWHSYIKNYQSGKSLEPLPEPLSDEEKYFVTSNQIYSTYYQIKAQEERLLKYTITAPFTGTLSKTMVDEGSLVSPGQPLGTFISNREYELEAGVPVQVAGALTPGQSLTFSNQNTGHQFSAKVVRINNIIDPSTQNVPVFLSVTGEGLRSGMYLEGRVILNRFENTTAIHKDILTRDNNVYVIENDIVRKREVEIMAVNNDSLIVRGLQDNDLLVLNSFTQPISGLKITN